MFNGRQINDKINRLHERVLRIVYNDTVTSFENLLIKDKSFTIHHQNIQSLAIDIYKAIHSLPGRNLTKFFVRNNHNYNIRSESELLQLKLLISILSLKYKILLVISNRKYGTFFLSN